MDNWLMGKRWYEKAIEMSDSLGVPIMGQSPLIYLSMAPMCQMYYAEALEKDGAFGEVARLAWASSADGWRRYGDEPIATSFQHEDSGEPVVIRLNDLEPEEQKAQERIARLEAIQPDLRKKLTAEKRAKLSAAQREALDAPAEKRTSKQWQLAAQAEEAVKVTNDELARHVNHKERKQAIQLAKDAAQHQLYASFIRRYREIVNFPFWQVRGKAEQSQDILTARQRVYHGDRAYVEGDPVVARDFYRQGLAAWRVALDAHKEYIADQTIVEDLMDVIDRYRRILGQLDEPFPKKFILQDVIDAQQRRLGTAPKEAAAKDAAPKDAAGKEKAK
jgi:hypothetical protein